MRSDRLLSILLLLQAHGRLSARELAGRLETSVRTVYRDIDALSAAGVPVVSERGRNGGTTILPGYRTDVTGLTPDEAEAIFVAAGRGALTDLGLEEQLSLGLRKLMAALPERQRSDTQRARDRVIVESGRWLRQPEPTPWLDMVRRAVLDERRLSLTYRSSSSDAARTSVVDPWGLVSKAGTWYLIAAPAAPSAPGESAADRGSPSGESRLYRISRIEDAVTLADPAVRPATLDVAAEWQRLRRRFEDRGPGVDVRVRVRRDRLEMLLRMAAPQLVGPAARPDPSPDPMGAGEWQTIHLPFVALGAAEALLLGFGTDVEVVAPPQLRTSMARTAAAIVLRYAAPDQAARDGRARTIRSPRASR